MTCRIRCMLYGTELVQRGSCSGQMCGTLSSFYVDSKDLHRPSLNTGYAACHYVTGQSVPRFFVQPDCAELGSRFAFSHILSSCWTFHT